MFVWSKMLQRRYSLATGMLVLSILATLMLPSITMGQVKIEGEDGYYRRDELPPPRLNSDPTKLLVIEQGRIFYNGKELRMEGECRRDEWEGILGSYDRVEDIGPSTYFSWDQLGIYTYCSWVSVKREVYRVTSIDVIFRFNTKKKPTSVISRALPLEATYPGYVLIDGVALTPKVTYDHYLRERTSRHFMNLRRGIVDLPAHHSVYRSRVYDVCKPYPLQVNIGWQANRNHIDFRRLYGIAIEDKVRHYKKHQCKDTPFSNYVTENCDADCAEHRGLAAISLFKRLLPHGAADQRDEAAEKHGLKDAPNISKQSVLTLLEQQYGELDSESTLSTRMQAFYLRFKHLITTE